MRALWILAVGVCTLIATEASAQMRPPGGPGSGQGGPGGGKGGFGKGGGMFGGGSAKDASAIFDYASKGRPYILISETRTLREPLTVFAKEQGITNDQITREQFLAFFPKYEYYAKGGAQKTNNDRGGDRPGGGGADVRPQSLTTPPPGAAPIAPGQNPLEAIAQWAEGVFKRLDQNGDSLLTPEEMPDGLRRELERWDTDRNGLIDIDEFKVYYSARLQMRDGANTPPNPITILIEEDYDRRPDVIRAGKLPKELPKWFTELDVDLDGQVALHEWLKAGKEVEEFKTWDRNDDGLITPEEVLFKQRASAGPALASGASPTTPSQASSDRPSGGGRGEWGARPSDGSGGGGRPGGFNFKDFWKKKSQ